MSIPSLAISSGIPSFRFFVAEPRRRACGERDEGGTGLGLAFVQELTEACEWTYRVTESAAGGARLKFADVAINKRNT